MANTQPARGMRDFLPADVRRREYVIAIIKDVYERYGFEPLETPAVENIETLLGKYGEEGNQLIFKILKRGEHEKSGEADLALRYDLTVPLARVVAEYKAQLPKFFKRYQIQPVWRADRPARGRFREFYQCDVDICGSRSLLVEAELCGAVVDVLKRLGFNDFTIRLNHRQLLTGIMDQAGVPAEKHADALIALDKLDKIGPSGVTEELQRRGIDDTASGLLMDFLAGLGQSGSALTVLDLVASFMGSHVGGNQAVSDLREIVTLIAAANINEHLRIDPTLARGLSYYTGAIMEISVPDLSGSLGGGGRYDNLIGAFLSQDVPACGFSLGLERIIVVMTEREMFPAELTGAPAEVMIAIGGDSPGMAEEALKLARMLRSSGIRVDVYPDRDEKLGKQFKHASNRKFPFVAVVGDDERLNNSVTIKNMQTGIQKTVLQADVVNAIENFEDTGARS